MHDMKYMNANRASLIFICESSSLSTIEASKVDKELELELESSREPEQALAVDPIPMADPMPPSKPLPSLKALATCVHASPSSSPGDSSDTGASSLELLGCLAIERLLPMMKESKSLAPSVVETKACESRLSSPKHFPLSLSLPLPLSLSHSQHTHHHQEPPHEQARKPIRYSFSAMYHRDEASSPDSVYDSDNGLKPKRKRANSQQLASLQSVFEKNPFPSTESRAALGKRLGMHPRSVQIWFQNKRQALKQKIE